MKINIKKIFIKKKKLSKRIKHIVKKLSKSIKNSGKKLFNRIKNIGKKINRIKNIGKKIIKKMVKKNEFSKIMILTANTLFIFEEIKKTIFTIVNANESILNGIFFILRCITITFAHISTLISTKKNPALAARFRKISLYFLACYLFAGGKIINGLYIFSALKF